MEVWAPLMEELTVHSAHFRPIDEDSEGRNTEIQNPQILKYFCADGKTYNEFDPSTKTVLSF